MAPLIAKLTTKKNLSVATALSSGRWMCGLTRIATEDELHQFLMLWEKVDEFQLNSLHDCIQCLPCVNGKYSAKSAYKMQFHGQILQPHLEKVWETKAEGKIKFFLWLWLKNRNWTADRLERRGLPCNATCSLCDQEPETAAHLTVGCSYSKEVWASLPSTNPQLARIANTSSVWAWWNKLQGCCPTTQRRRNITLACYTVWNIWKERGRRVFEGQEKSAAELACLINDEVSVFSNAQLS